MKTLHKANGREEHISIWKTQRGNLYETIYMKLYETNLYDTTSENQSQSLIRRLNRFLYGLKQAPKVWNLNFDAVKELNFRQLSHDRYLYIHGYGSVKTYFLLNVNDIILVGTDERDLRKVKAALSTAFCMSDLEEFHCFLRIKVKRGKEETKLSQPTYIQNSLTIWQRT